MKAYPVEWYEENLKNMKIGLERDIANIASQQADVAAFTKRVQLLERQIARAKKEKKAAFNSDRYLA